jgi:all-trans-8'-apo-beta-carotenal 15,15'-oxygenase
VQGDGWLVGTVLDVPAQVTRVGAFDALHLADGPIVSASLPYTLPLGFHGHFAAY